MRETGFSIMRTTKITRGSVYFLFLYLSYRLTKSSIQISMKKIHILFSLLFILSSNALLAKDIKGIIITKTNDTLHVTFTVSISFFTQEPNLQKMQWKVKYLDSTNTKQILRPADAKEVSFSYEGETIRMISLKNNLGLSRSIFTEDSCVFLKLVIDGKLRLYNYYYTQSSGGGYYNSTAGMYTGGGSYTAETFILQKNTSELFQSGSMSFKKDMIKYFSDCPAIVKKLEDKTYRRKDVELIVNEYNKDCVTK